MLKTRTNGNVTIKFSQPGLQTGKGKDGRTYYVHCPAKAAVTCYVSMPDADGQSVRHAVTASVNCKSDEHATADDAMSAEFRWRSGGSVLAALPSAAKDYVLEVLEEVLAELRLPTGQLRGWYAAVGGECVAVVDAAASVYADTLVYHEEHTDGEWIEARKCSVLREILHAAWPDDSVRDAAAAKLANLFGKALPATAVASSRAGGLTPKMPK